MAEDRTLGLARQREPEGAEVSKEELQRRMEEARDSISHTVTEIKESVAHQYEAVKQTLDWREQFKKRPVVWSLGALGIGFIAGYGIAAAVKGQTVSDNGEYRSSEIHAYAAEPMLGRKRRQAATEPESDQGPGLIERFTSTPVYGRVREEAATVGNTFLKEITKTAQQIILPAVITSIRDFLTGHLKAGKDLKTSANRSSSQPVERPN